jgi:hypothetical protein
LITNDTCPRYKESMLENVLLLVFAGTSFEYESEDQKDQWF